MKKILMLVAVLTSFTFAQYNSNGTDNTVVMWSKYKWTNMSEVDGGSAADRNQAVNTWYSKTNQANKLLKSSMFLYHGRGHESGGENRFFPRYARGNKGVETRMERRPRSGIGEHSRKCGRCCGNISTAIFNIKLV